MYSYVKAKMWMDVVEFIWLRIETIGEPTKQ
jgi:hypothetical protein